MGGGGWQTGNKAVQDFAQYAVRLGSDEEAITRAVFAELTGIDSRDEVYIWAKQFVAVLWLANL